MSIPDYKAVVVDLAARYPDEWRAAHYGGPQTEAFVRRLAWVLHQIDPLVGLNGKRGDPRDLSDDCVCYLSPGKSIDVRTGQSVSVMDVIGSAGSSAASPSWGEVWDPKVMPTHATWVQPEPVGGEAPGPNPPPPPPPPPPAPGPNLQPIIDRLAALESVVARVEAQSGNQHGDVMREIAGIRSAIAELTIPAPAPIKFPKYAGSVRLGRPIVLAPVPEE